MFFAIIDWQPRYVVSWELDQTLEMPSGLYSRAFKTALLSIFNSDRGSHFTSNSYIERVLSKNILISMDGKGRAIDNIFTEKLWRIIIHEEVYLNKQIRCREHIICSVL